MKKLLLFIFGLLSVSCSSVDLESPEVTEQKEKWIEKGWIFVETVGEQHAETKYDSYYTSEKKTITAYASCSGGDLCNHGSQTYTKSYEQNVFDYLIVNMVYDPAGSCCLIFKRKKSN